MNFAWKQGVDPNPKPPKMPTRSTLELNSTLTEIVWGHDVQLIKVFIHNLIRKRRYTNTENQRIPP